MKRRLFILVLVFTLGSGAAFGEDYVDLNEKGNEAFTEGQFEKALEYYQDAEIEKPETPPIQYNHANTLLETGRFEEAVEKYGQAMKSQDSLLQSKILYNTGNGYFGRQEYQKAIEAYQNTLDLNPDDLDAKHNLELARLRLEEMEQQPQDKNQDQQEQKQEEQEEQQEQDQEQQEQEDQQQQNQDEQEKEQQQQQQQEGKEGDEEQQSQPQEPKQEEMSKEDAERILNALAQQEEANQQMKKRLKVSGTYKGSDW